MNRFLAATLGVLLAATAVDALAQGFPSARGRDEGRGQGDGQGQAQDRGFQGGSHGGSDARSGGRGDGDGRHQRGDDSREPTPQVYGRGQTEQHSQGYGFGQVPNYGGGQRVDQGGLSGVRTEQLEQRVDSNRGGWNGYGDGRQNHNYGRDDRRDNRYDRHDNNWGRSDYGLPDANGYRRDGRDYNRYDNRYDRRDHNWGRSNWRDHNWRRSWSHGWSGSRYRAPSRYYYPRGYSSRSWSIGIRLPSAYYAPSYYIDYNYYGLAAPPYGCYWVRADRDVLLIDIGTGEVVDVLYGFFY